MIFNSKLCDKFEFMKLKFRSISCSISCVNILFSYLISQKHLKQINHKKFFYYFLAIFKLIFSSLFNFNLIFDNLIIYFSNSSNSIVKYSLIYFEELL